jgi:bifunctional pyridoxal-dependent enzyme with beta-cystathionase and maltose regulon repressor activities
VSLVSGQKENGKQLRRFERRRGLVELAKRFIPTCGDLHLLNQSAISAITSVSAMIIVVTPAYTSFMRNLKPTLPTSTMRPG